MKSQMFFMILDFLVYSPLLKFLTLIFSLPHLLSVSVSPSPFLSSLSIPLFLFKSSSSIYLSIIYLYLMWSNLRTSKDKFVSTAALFWPKKVYFNNVLICYSPNSFCLLSLLMLLYSPLHHLHHGPALQNTYPHHRSQFKCHLLDNHFLTIKNARQDFWPG